MHLLKVFHYLLQCILSLLCIWHATPRCVHECCCRTLTELNRWQVYCWKRGRSCRRIKQGSKIFFEFRYVSFTLWMKTALKSEDLHVFNFFSNRYSLFKTFQIKIDLRQFSNLELHFTVRSLTIPIKLI